MENRSTSCLACLALKFNVHTDFAGHYSIAFSSIQFQSHKTIFENKIQIKGGIKSCPQLPIS